MNVMGIIFTNDANIGDLTAKRSIASIPFGGRYRQVDFGLTNLSWAGVHHLAIISRFNYQSLMDHIGDGEEWGLELGEGGLQYITPYANSQTHSYRGKLESLYNALPFLEYGKEDEYVFLVDSAVTYNIDLKKALADHIKSGKDITVVVKRGVANSKRMLDLAVTLDENKEVTDIVVDYAASPEYLASLDLFVTTKKWLINMVRECMAHNAFHMDRDLILGGWRSGKVSVNAFEFEGITLYNESVQDYFENSMALLKPDVHKDIFERVHPVYTKVRDRVPSYYGADSSIDNCMVADGCMLGGSAKDSILFRQVTLAPGAHIEDCVVMNDTVIGEGAELKNVILDKNITVRPGAKLIGTRNNPIVIKRGDTV